MTETPAAVARLWDRHRRVPFPAHLHGVEVGGADLVLLDADMAGCVQSWLQAGGQLDDMRRLALRRRITDLGHLLPDLVDAESHAYFIQLRLMAAAIVDS